MKKQNKISGYLAVTVGAGCAATVAEGAIQIVDLSGLSTDQSAKTFPGTTGDQNQDLGATGPTFNGKNGGLTRGGTSAFYSDVQGIAVSGYLPMARGYSGGAADFPSQYLTMAVWSTTNPAPGSSDSGFSVGLNWVAFKDSADNYGWLSFTLDNLGANTSDPISSFGQFVYDDTSTSPANAISLEIAVAAASVPEPSSLALLALGATGLATRRNRKKTA